MSIQPFAWSGLHGTFSLANLDIQSQDDNEPRKQDTEYLANTTSTVCCHENQVVETADIENACLAMETSEELKTLKIEIQSY